MSNLIHYFSSFDKLMKEKLVLPLFWLLILMIGLSLLSEVFRMIGINFLDHVIDFINLFLTFLVAFVGIRLLCEIAVAIFRINDNLSPDKGRSELADIDPVAEARRAAEDAARRAREAADQAFERTSSATRKAVDSTRATISKASQKTEEAFDDLGDSFDSAKDSVKSRMGKSESPVTKDSYPEQAVLRPSEKSTTVPRKRGRPKGSKNKIQTDPESGVRLKKDGTPARKPGPKPKSTATKSKSTSAKSKTAKAKTTKTTSSAKKTTKGSTKPRKRGRPKGSKTVYKVDPVTGQRLKKDGTPAKKPGPKSKS